MKIFSTRQTSKHRSSLAPRSAFVTAAVVLGGASILGATIRPESAQAFNIGKYRLGSHPGGSVAAPYYGLRLDGLLTGDSGDIYTFDFKDVLLKYDGSSINISGSVYGGLDIGSEYQDPTNWDIDFTYKKVASSGDSLVANKGRGSIASSDRSFKLRSFRGGHENSFALRTNHRGVSGYSGFGWLNHAPTDGGPGGNIKEHLYASDWLFTAQPVPEPTTILATLLAAGGAQVMNRKRKRLAAKSSKQS